MDVDPKFIFVFGSNLAGRHGKGAALTALNEYGAIYGKGVGMQGNSYAIPTKSAQLKPLHLRDIDVFVKQFIRHAKRHPELHFYLTPIGCGLAGYKPEHIAPFFKDAPANVEIPPAFLTVNATVAQPVEQSARNGSVTGSIPVSGSNKGL